MAGQVGPGSAKYARSRSRCDAMRSSASDETRMLTYTIIVLALFMIIGMGGMGFVIMRTRRDIRELRRALRRRTA